MKQEVINNSSKIWWEEVIPWEIALKMKSDLKVVIIESKMFCITLGENHWCSVKLDFIDYGNKEQNEQNKCRNFGSKLDFNHYLRSRLKYN